MSDIIIIKPEVVQEAEKRKVRDRQLERRRLAHDYLKVTLSLPESDYKWEGRKIEVESALALADELLKQTEAE